MRDSTRSKCPRCKPRLTPPQYCSEHANVLADGEFISAPMMLMDSLQRSVAANGRPAEPVTEEQRRAIRAQAYQDHYREQHEARQRAIAADPALAAYHAQYKR